MELTTFLAHFFYIGIFFAGGVVVGWITYERGLNILKKFKRSKG